MLTWAPQRTPTFSDALTAMRSRGRNTEAPGLWGDLGGYWPTVQGGGATLFDVSGYGNHGGLTNGASWTIGSMGHTLDFAGTDQRVEFAKPVNLGLSVYPGGSSISFWAQADAWGVNDYIYGEGSSSGTQRSGRFDGLGHVGFNSGTTFPYTTGSFADGQWHHIVVSIRPVTTYGQKAIFFDGKLDIDWTETSINSSYNCVNQRINHFGYNPLYGSFDGRISQWAHFGTLLSSSQIQQLHADPHAMIRPRITPYPTATVAGGISPTANINGPLVGPLGGAI